MVSRPRDGVSVGAPHGFDAAGAGAGAGAAAGAPVHGERAGSDAAGAERVVRALATLAALAALAGAGGGAGRVLGGGVGATNAGSGSATSSSSTSSTSGSGSGSGSGAAGGGGGGAVRASTRPRPSRLLSMAGLVLAGEHDRQQNRRRENTHSTDDHLLGDGDVLARTCGRRPVVTRLSTRRPRVVSKAYVIKFWFRVRGRWFLFNRRNLSGNFRLRRLVVESISEPGVIERCGLRLEPRWRVRRLLFLSGRIGNLEGRR